MIQSLIDKQDNFEIVRDKIASILTLEVANQMALAGDAEKDPLDWKLRIFLERDNPFEQWLNSQDDPSPIVNVWFDNASFDPAASNVAERQASEGIFNIDCYGFGKSSNVSGGGHKPGDRESALAAHKALRLVRNILRASVYTYLDLQGTVGGHWPQSFTVFQPQIDGREVQNVTGARFALRARYNELSPQYEGQPLEYVAVDVYRDETGEVYPLPLEMREDLEMTGGMEMTGGPVLYLKADYDYRIPKSLEMEGSLEMGGDVEMSGEG